jgi:hypothetical protein
MIRATAGDDDLTKDLSIRWLAAEKEHRVLVRGN